jgi:hypothetical protein
MHGQCRRRFKRLRRLAELSIRDGAGRVQRHGFAAQNRVDVRTGAKLLLDALKFTPFRRGKMRLA